MAAFLMKSCAPKSSQSIVISKLFKTIVIPSVSHKCRYSNNTPKIMDESVDVNVRSMGGNWTTIDLRVDRPDWVVTTDDGRTIVCWHPEQEFPYECTKPLPILEGQLNEEDSELKIQYRLDYVNRNNVFDGPSPLLNAVNLGKFMYTNKHRWFPQNDKRYRKPNPPVDREGL